MNTFAHIQHKLNRDGYSQLDRQNQMLSPSEVKIDGRETKDILQFIDRYARQINYFDVSSENRNGDWIPFFRNSIPFQYAIIASYDLNALDDRFEKVKNAIQSRKSFKSLHLLFDLIFDMSDQITQWSSDLQADNSGLKIIIENLIQTNLKDQLTKLIQLANSAGKWGYKRAKNGKKLESNWGIRFKDLYKVDRTFLTLRGSIKHKVYNALATLEEIYRTFWKAFQNIISIANDGKQLEKSITNDGLQKHQPHLGLLFAFLRLFSKAQGGLNKLSESHLDFFYKKVLQLKNQPVIPDQAHLTFELAKKVEEDILIEKGTRFKAGKDKNGKDIFFTLDDELIVSKAKVADLRTLHIDRYVNGTENAGYQEDIKTVEGIYMAAVANSPDGNGEQDFEKDKPPLWSTVGAKLSKWTDPDQSKGVAEDQNHARLGFMLASKILFLREGKRLITIDLELDSDLSEWLTSGLFKDLLEKEKDGETTFSNLMVKVFRVNGGSVSFGDILALYQKDTPLSEVFATVESIDKNYETIEEILTGIWENFPPQDIFNIYLTTEEGWEQINYELQKEENTNTISVSFDHKKKKLSFVITVPADFPAILTSNPKLLEADYGYAMPMIKFELNNGASRAAYSYSVLRTKKICKIDIDVTVCDVRQLILQNDFTLIDINKPFMPFGPIPKKESSNFYIGSEEIFCKRWDCIEINPKWKDLPKNGNGSINFTNYYQGYATPPLNESFEATLKILNGKNWIPNSEEDGTKVKLFSTNENNGEQKNGNNPCPIVECEKSDFPWTIKIADFEDWGPCTEITNIQNGYLTETPCGFLKLKLGDQDFLHDDYANTLISAIQNLVEIEDLKVELEKDVHDDDKIQKLIKEIVNEDGTVTLLNAPYTPLIESLSVNYSASTSSAHKDEIKFAHLHPFHGTYEKLDIMKEEEEGDKKVICKPSILPCYADEGTLYIGLENYKPGSNLNLSFQMEPASADPDMNKAVVCWEYLRNNSWKPLDIFTHVLSDTTNGLIQSGIVQLSIPSDITNEKTTVLPNGLHWIKARVLLRTAAIADSLAVKAHAIQATFVPGKESDLSRLSAPLNGGKIAKFETPLAGIKGVTQEYPGFGGRPKEASSTFYQRISEHLRHKGRAVSIYDYERIILQQFEEIYKVKCISHTLGRRGLTSDYELAPGYVTIVVIPDLDKVNAVDPLQPKVPAATLEKIKRMLRERISPFVKLEVLNPIFETVRVEARVKFKAGKSKIYYEDKLAEDVTAFLAPWAFSDTRKDISFGGQIYYSTVLKFIEDQHYVEYLEKIKMKRNKENESAEVIVASNSRVILTSGAEHKFTAIEYDDQFVMINAPTKKGIGFNKIPKI